jgi:hypothetical protein
MRFFSGNAVTALIVFLMLIGGVTYTYTQEHGRPPPPPAPTDCAGTVICRAEAVAIFDAWMQVDCDELDIPFTAPSFAACTDEAGKADHAPIPGPVVQRGRWTIVTVYIVVGNVRVGYRVTVDDRTWQAVNRVVVP